MKQLQNVVGVSSNELEKSLLNELDKTAVNYVAGRPEAPMLDLTNESIVRDEDAGCCDLGDFSLHHEESGANKEDGAQEIEESQPLESGPGEL